jgi:hypothetical protein
VFKEIKQGISYKTPAEFLRKKCRQGTVRQIVLAIISISPNIN